MNERQDAVVFLGTEPMLVWPEGQAVEPFADPTIFITRFADAERYHPRLIARILDMEQRPHLRHRYTRGACGTKVRDVERWNFSEADLIHARALEFFRKVIRSRDAVVDVSWANVYRSGDYCIPHSHIRSTASVVYFVDSGNPDPDDREEGRFCIVDPRLPACCPAQESCMTTPLMPATAPGTMLIFPSQVVHSVNPYLGSQPRITMSWNISTVAVPGRAVPD